MRDRKSFNSDLIAIFIVLVLLFIQMPYRLLNIGQLLFLLPNPELKQKVPILEKLNKRFINAKIGIIFNRTYIYIIAWF